MTKSSGPLTRKDVRSLISPVRSFLTSIENTQIIPSNDDQKEKLKDSGKELLSMLDELIEKYNDLYERLNSKKKTAPTPRLCDNKLGKYIASFFNVTVPELKNGQHTYSILSPNEQLPTAITLIVKKKGKYEGQNFELPSELADIFKSHFI